MTTPPTIAGRLTLSLREKTPLDLGRLKGIGPKTKKRLQARGIQDQLDLLLYIPRKYRPTYRFYPGPQILEDKPDWVEAVGTIEGVVPKKSYSRAPFEVRLDVQGAPFKLLWFHLPYRGFDRAFKNGDTLHFEGKVDYERGLASLSHPKAKRLKQPPDRPPRAEISPVYSSIEDVRDSLIADAAATACKRLAPLLAEGLPKPLLATNDLPSIADALATIHVVEPVDDLERFHDDLLRARDRLIFEEFFDLQSALTERYVSERRAARAPQCDERELGRQLVRNLPFKLTGDQKKAIATIADEMQSSVPMRRLLQGDVGSGKTVVAMMAAAIAIDNGVQVAMMAPTGILASQHLRRAQTLFGDLGVPFATLTGSQSAAERRDRLGAIRSGHARLIIGTHALFQEGVEFEELGLIIVDEEHKFGVEQREALMALGRDPHLLAMTATPIPRTLAHAVFGDRDLTVIAEKPPGRKPIRTVLRDRSRAPRVYDYVRQRIAENGEQAYFVYPLVEENDDLPNRKSVVATAEHLANGPFKNLRVGVLHGRMPGEAKKAVMDRFADGKLDVLCSTTVIEVGLDVANATMMVIENAELFGLSQLHQLRGRIGRGQAASLCVLLAGFGLTDDARQRLRAMVATDDGFKLAELDLQIRGPGEFLGMKQAGLPEFRFGDILRDADLMQRARRDARRLLLGDAAR